MMVFFQARLEKILVCQKFSGTWEADFKSFKTPSFSKEQFSNVLQNSYS